MQGGSEAHLTQAGARLTASARGRRNQPGPQGDAPRGRPQLPGKQSRPLQTRAVEDLLDHWTSAMRSTRRKRTLFASAGSSKPVGWPKVRSGRRPGRRQWAGSHQ
eukprot:12181723-Heterocapsa_arctica.AAC.1